MCDPTTCIRTLIGSSSFTIRAWWCEDRRSDPVRVEARFIRLEILDCQVHVQEGAQTRNMHAHTCLCSQLLLGQLRHVAELNDCWDNGKAKLNFFKDMWDKTLRNLPPDFVPMWGQMEDSGDRSGFTFTPHFSRVADNRPPGQQLLTLIVRNRPADGPYLYGYVYVYVCASVCACVCVYHHINTPDTNNADRDHESVSSKSASVRTRMLVATLTCKSFVVQHHYRSLSRIDEETSADVEWVRLCCCFGALTDRASRTGNVPKMIPLNGRWVTVTRGDAKFIKLNSVMHDFTFDYSVCRVASCCSLLSVSGVIILDLFKINHCESICQVCVLVDKER